MRISTNTIYDLGVGSIQQQTGDLLKLQQQIATSRRILTPSDDPVASARVLEVSQSKSMNEQYAVNADSAKTSLELEEAALSSLTSLIQDVKTVAVYAGNGGLTDSDRTALATELRGRYQELMGLANSTDGNGQYLFSGYKGAIQPFAEPAPGNVAYSGDQGQRLAQIAPSRQIAMSDAGSDVFMQVKNGNRTFVTSATATNTGTGVVSPGNVLDPAKWNASARDYVVKFQVAGNVTTYDILDSTGTTSLITGGAPTYSRTYTDGGTISLKRLATDPAGPAFDFGMELGVQGAPANNDSFKVKASTNESIFTTLNNLINAVATPITSSTGKTNLSNALNTALSNLDNGLDNVLTVRASVGARLKEIDTAKSTGEDLALQYQQTISAAQDLDYAKAFSDLTLQKVNLEAAQKSFLKVQELSLFSLI